MPGSLAYHHNNNLLLPSTFTSQREPRLLIIHKLPDNDLPDILQIFQKHNLDDRSVNIGNDLFRALAIFSQPNGVLQRGGQRRFRSGLSSASAFSHGSFSPRSFLRSSSSRDPIHYFLCNVTEKPCYPPFARRCQSSIFT